MEPVQQAITYTFYYRNFLTKFQTSSKMETGGISARKGQKILILEELHFVVDGVILLEEVGDFG